MSEVTALNYKALGLSGTEQLGSSTKSSSSTDFTDGLTLSELEKIDSNGDGVITEAEFKAVYKGSNADTYWETYTNYYNATTKTKSDGSYTVTQTLSDGTTVKSTYDKNGNLTGYKTVKTSSSGLTTTTAYDSSGTKTSKTTENADGSTTKIKYDSDGNKVSKTTTLEDGSSSTYNYSKKTWTHKAADGSSVTTDKSGNITKVSAGDTEMSIKYNSDGSIKSVTVNGTKYTGDNINESSSGKITIKDSKGNTVLTKKTDSSGETDIIRYENGEKAEKIELNSDNEPDSIYDYENGYASSRTYCNTGRTRKYTRDSKGNILYSTDYDSSGTLLSKQTYVKNGSTIFKNNSDGLWATRVFYNSDGSVKKYETYDYSTNDGGETVLKTTNKYSDTSCSTLLSTTYTDMDSYRNKLESTTENYETGAKSTTTYNYSEDGVYYSSVNYKTAKVSKKHLVSTVTVKTTDTEIITTTKTYSNGQVVSKTTQTEEIASSDDDETSTTSSSTDATDTTDSSSGTDETDSSETRESLEAEYQDLLDEYQKEYGALADELRAAGTDIDRIVEINEEIEELRDEYDDKLAAITLKLNSLD